MKRPAAFIAVFVLGAAVMFIFDSTLTLLAGVILQTAAIVLGVFAIATPEFLSGDDEDA